MLKQINGGTLLENLDDEIEDTANFFKTWGYTFEDFKMLVATSYNQKPSLYSTTGSSEDLEELIKRFESAWNR